MQCYEKRSLYAVIWTYYVANALCTLISRADRSSVSLACHLQNSLLMEEKCHGTQLECHLASIPCYKLMIVIQATGRLESVDVGKVRQL